MTNSELCITNSTYRSFFTPQQRMTNEMAVPNGKTHQHNFLMVVSRTQTLLLKTTGRFQIMLPVRRNYRSELERREKIKIYWLVCSILSEQGPGLAEECPTGKKWRIRLHYQAKKMYSLFCLYMYRRKDIKAVLKVKTSKLRC